MIINQPKNTATVSGFADTGNFSIKASAKAFRILSDNIYKYKQEAIVRELSTNAMDAHFDAGQTRPFDVTLPDFLDPTFRIRDYGTGLSHELVMRLYTTYFESTKDGSNDYNGALGLGSKSPFSYTNTFTVDSYFDGMKRTYAAYISDADTPAILLATEVETTEPNGLSISFSVKSEDINSFVNAVNRILFFFPEGSYLVNGGGHTPAIDSFSITDSTDLYDIYEQKYNYYENNKKWTGTYVLQANVLYPVNIEAIGEKVKLSEEQRDVLTRSFIIKVPTGAVNFAPSREELNYDSHTVDNLLTYVDQVYSQVSDYVVKSLAAETSMWKRTILFNRKFSSASVYGFPSLQNSAEISPGKIKVPENARIYSYGSTKAPTTSYHYNEKADYGFANIRPDEKLTIFVMYAQSGIAAFQDWRKDNNRCDGYWGHNDILVIGTKDAVTETLTRMGNPDFTDVTNEVNVKPKPKRTTYYGWATSYPFSRQADGTIRGTEDIADLTGYYMLVDNFTDFRMQMGSMRSFSTMFDYWRSAGASLNCDTILFIREADKDDVLANVNLKPFVDYFVDLVKNYENPNNTPELYVSNMVSRNYQVSSFLRIIRSIKVNNVLNLDTRAHLQEILDVTGEVKNNVNVSDQIANYNILLEQVSRLLNVKVDNAIDMTHHKTAYNAVIESIQRFKSKYGNGLFGQVLDCDYIELINALDAFRPNVNLNVNSNMTTTTQF